MGGLPRKQQRPLARASRLLASQGEDTWYTLGRVIPQGMQREDGSTDRKALGKLGDEGERKRATAKEVAAAGKLERQ